jgi:DNA (cytosine-5)-methyltransferase 1
VTYGSVCSGIEAPSAAWHPLGWKPLWFAEIEPFPKAVLAHRYPEVPDLGDMTTLPARILAGEVPDVDVFVGGTPCQSFSVAGLRLGLADPRGQLTRTYVEILDALDTVRLAKGKPPTVALWENVPGVLSDKDNAFGNFLAALCGEDDALLPAGPKWTYAGSVLGPRRALAWRVLDAQHFGVAQRRRRVFVVASARVSRVDPVEVLLVEQGVCWDPPSRGEAGQSPAASPTPGAGSSSGEHDAVGDGGRGRGVAFDTTQITNPHNRSNPQPGDPCHPLAAGAHPPAVAFALDVYNQTLTGNVSKPIASRDDQDTASVIAQAAYPDPAYAISGGEQHFGTGRSNQDTFVCSSPGVLTFEAPAIGVFRQSDVAGVMLKHTGMGSGETQNPAFVLCANEGVVGARTARGGRNAGMANDDLDARRFALQSVALQAMAFKASHYTRGKDGAPSEVFPPLSADADKGDQDPVVHQAMAVRRLTPVECERLQGFPDDYTDIPWKGKPAGQCPDGPRYKALGNSMAVPVIRWIGLAIARSL